VGEGYRHRVLSFAMALSLPVMFVAAIAKADLRAATAEETGAIQELWQVGARALLSRDSVELSALANAATLELIAADRRLAASAGTDALLERAREGAGGGCIPHASALRALDLRTRFEGFFLATLSERELLRHALAFVLEQLDPAHGSRRIALPNGRRLATFVAFPTEQLRVALLDRVETEPGFSWRMLGADALLIDDAGQAFLAGGARPPLALWPRWELGSWPVASRTEDGSWRLDLRWIMGPLAERNLHLNAAARWSRRTLAGWPSPWPRFLERFDAGDLRGFYTLYVPELDRKPKALFEPTEPWEAAALPCPFDLWPKRRDESFPSLLAAGLRSIDFLAPTASPEMSHAVMLRVAAVLLALWQAKPDEAMAAADKRTLLAFEALRHAALHAPRDFLLRNGPLNDCFRSYSAIQVLRLRARFPPDRLTALSGAEVGVAYFGSAMGDNPDRCQIMRLQMRSGLCVFGPQPANPLDLMVEQEAFIAALADPGRVAEAMQAARLDDYLVVENHAFGRRSLGTGPNRSSFAAALGEAGAWQVNLAQAIDSLEMLTAVAMLGKTVPWELVLLGWYGRFTGEAGTESLFEPPVPEGFDPDKACFLKTLLLRR